MGRIITFSNALKEALSEEMARDERVYLIGQDLKYNVWGVTNGLNQKFGDGRVLHAPISENGFVSSALGSALVGSRPVVELMYSDFLLLAADAVADEAGEIPLYERRRGISGPHDDPGGRMRRRFRLGRAPRAGFGGHLHPLPGP